VGWKRDSRYGPVASYCELYSEHLVAWKAACMRRIRCVGGLKAETGNNVTAGLVHKKLGLNLTTLSETSNWRRKRLHV
jgi:hypothetical protein